MSVTGAARETLLGIVRERFRPGPGSDAGRVGIEVETLPVRTTDGVPVPPRDDARGTGTLAVLRGLGGSLAWEEIDSGYGLPSFRLPDGALLSYEPGGQLEYSSAVHRSPASLDAALCEIFDRLGAAMEREGTRLLTRGLDPLNAAGDAAMVIDGDRYRRQRAHYDRKGGAGRAMMLRTAGIHLNLDFGREPPVAWDAANAIAPHLVAIFANSPVRPDASPDDVPHRSHRAAIWRALDPSRTRIFAPSVAPAEPYLDFALGAESFLLGSPEGPSSPFAHWLDAGATDDDFRRHLTTLFPEVRPRGYLELRSVDTLRAHWCVVPLALASVALHHESARTELLRELPPPSLERLERAGRLGLADAELGSEVGWLVRLLVDALDGRARDQAERAVVERVKTFMDRFTLRGRDPGSEPA